MSINKLMAKVIDDRSPYQQQVGAFSNFLSDKRKSAWHRINTEHLLMQANKQGEEIKDVLIQGIQINLDLLGEQNDLIKKQHSLLGYVGEGVQNMVDELQEQRKVLNNSQIILKEMLDSIKNPRATEAAEKSRQAERNMYDAKELSKTRAERLLSEAVDLLNESIMLNDYDYEAHFNLGWLYSFYLNDLEKADEHFDTATLRSINRDKKFAAYSLRHLADVRIHAGDYDGALAAIAEAEELDVDNIETKYEYARYLLLAGRDDAAGDKLKETIEINPSYHALASLERDFNRSDKIQRLLNHMLDRIRSKFSDLFDSKANEIKDKYYDALDKNDLHDYLDKKKSEFEVTNNKRGYYEMVTDDGILEIVDLEWKTERDVERERKKEESRIQRVEERKREERREKTENFYRWVFRLLISYPFFFLLLLMIITPIVWVLIIDSEARTALWMIPLGVSLVILFNDENVLMSIFFGLICLVLGGFGLIFYKVYENIVNGGFDGVIDFYFSIIKYIWNTVN